MTQPSLFDTPVKQRKPRFDGATYDPAKDEKRLTSQLEKTRKLMRDGAWRTLPAIHAVVGGSESALSARLRDFRKEGHQVQTRRANNGGTWEYRLVLKGGGE